MGTTFDSLSSEFDWRADDVEWPVTSEVGQGLEGVIAETTKVVWLDPSSGTLAYRGVAIEDLAFSVGYEEVAYLLINGVKAENDPEGFATFRTSLRASRELPEDVVALIAAMDPETHPTRLLRAGVSALGCHELSAVDDLAGEWHWRELRIVGQVMALVGAIARLRRGWSPLTPEPGQSLAEGVLSSLLDRLPEEYEVRALDLAWVMFAAHGLDAPTFTSMIVASCLADPYANVVAGLSALRGPRTGGATERVLDQVLPLAGGRDAESWVRAALGRGETIAGFGHRTLAMPDPRVVVLRKALAALARRAGKSELFATVRGVEAAATRALASKGVHVNLNLYGAPVFHLLGAEPAEVPIMVAAARMAGLAAFVREALGTIRLFRPLARYCGEAERTLDLRVMKS
jgi:citrate synthase